MIQPVLRSVAFRAAAAVLTLGTVGGAVGVAHAAPIGSPAAQATTTTTSTTSAATVTSHMHAKGRRKIAALHRRIKRGERKAVLHSLNLTPKQFHQDRLAGESIAAIAQSANVPLQTVTGAMDNAAQTVLQHAVTAGKITSTREQTLLTKVEANIQKWVNSTPHPKSQTATSTASKATQP